MIRIFTLVLFLVNIFIIFCQSESKIKKYGINEVKEYYLDSLNKQQLLSYKRFDKSGNTIYEEEYSKKGTLKLKVERVFDKKSNVLEEKFYNDKGNIVEHILYAYTFNLLQKETHTLTTKKGQEVFTIVYFYNGFKEKIKEEKRNEANVLVEVTEYEYNQYSLKTKKVRKSADGKLLEVKEYSYQIGN